MKRFLILLILFVSSISFTVNAQAQSHDDIRAIKISLITDMMNLSSSQASQFWPVYNKYEAELKVVYASRRNLTKERGKTAEEIIDERQQLDEREVAIKARYKNDFLKVVSPTQLNQMYLAEAKFKEMLLQRRDKMGGR